MNTTGHCRMPVASRTVEDRERHVGVEIEMSGLSYQNLVACAARILDGNTELASRYVCLLYTSPSPRD